MDHLDSLHDDIATEIDKRKIQKLLDDGVITEDQLRNAEIINLTDTKEETK